MRSLKPSRKAALGLLCAGLCCAGPFALFAQISPAPSSATPAGTSAPAATPTAAPPNSVQPPAPNPTALPGATAAPLATVPPSAPSAASTPVPKPIPAATPKPEPLTPREAVDSLSNGDTRQALDLIRANYVHSGTLTEDALNRATLQGLLERLGPGASVDLPESADTGKHPFRSEILDDRIGYIRLGSISKDHLAEFDAALGNFAAKKLGSLILDLRATPASSDFELAAEFIKRLTPKGKMLFAVHRPSAKQEQMYTSSQDPTFEGVMATLVNRGTGGAGEVIAAVLRATRNALVIGQHTSGQAAEFATLPLRGGKVLRVAVAEVKLPENLAIFPEGLTPDLAVEVSPRREAEILRVGLEKGVSGLVFETERARLNEAALVAGINPELDEAEEAQRNGENGENGDVRALSDPTIQRAVDLLTTINIFNRKPAAIKGR